MLPAEQSPPPNNRETANAPRQVELFLRNFFRGMSVFRVERRKGPWLDTPSPHPTT